MCISEIITAAAAAGSAALGYQSAGNAADAQAGAARQAADLQREMFYQNRADMMPGIEAGNRAREAYMYELGIGAHPTNYRGFQATPGYEFMAYEANKANNRAASASGRLDSGATRKAAMRYGNSLAASEYGNHLTRLAGGMASGANTTNALASLGASSAANQGNALMSAGTARASGYMGQANALGNGLTDLAGIGTGYYGGR